MITFKDQLCKILKFEDQMCNFIPGILLDFSDLLRTKIDIFELKCEKCSPAPAYKHSFQISCPFDRF